MENLKFRNCSRRRIVAVSSIEGNVLLGCFEPADTLSSIMRAIKGIHLAGRVDWQKKISKITSSVRRVLPLLKIFSTDVSSKPSLSRFGLRSRGPIKFGAKQRNALRCRYDPTLIPDALTPLLRLRFFPARPRLV